MTNQPYIKGKAKVLVDAGKPLGKLRRVWRYMGYDEINYTATPNGEATLKKFMNLEKEPYHVRAHHLLCTGNSRGVPKWSSTNVYIEYGKGVPIYNWRVVDEIFDTYLKYDLKPFVELGFVPRDLADDRGQPSQLWWYGGWSCPPKDYQKWYSLIHSLVKQCADRYGPEEASTWYWELWNEPDMDYYWKGSFEEYCKLYDYTEWIRQGRTNYPTRDQTKMIRSRENLELYEPRHQVTVQVGKFRKIITLPVHGISLLILSRK